MPTQQKVRLHRQEGQLSVSVGQCWAKRRAFVFFWLGIWWASPNEEVSSHSGWHHIFQQALLVWSSVHSWSISKSLVHSDPKVFSWTGHHLNNAWCDEHSTPFRRCIDRNESTGRWALLSAVPHYLCLSQSASGRHKSGKYGPGQESELILRRWKMGPMASIRCQLHKESAPMFEGHLGARSSLLCVLYCSSSNP
jgi:hypothetical protein